MTVLVSILLTIGGLYSINKYSKLAFTRLVSDLMSKRDNIEKELQESVADHQKYLDELSATAATEDEKKLLVIQEEFAKKTTELSVEYQILDKAFRTSMKEEATLNLIACAYAVVGKNMPSRNIVDDELKDAVISHRRSLGNLKDVEKMVGGLN